MASDYIKIGGTGLITSLGDLYVRSTRFALISAGTSGTVTLPSNSSVILDDFGGTVDAIITQVSGSKPTLSHALTSLGAVVSTTFDSSGNWVLSAAPAAYNVAIVYRVKQRLSDFDSASADIWGVPVVDDAITRSFGIAIDGGGQAITTGVKGDIVVPFDCTIQGWTLIADQSGSIVIDVWKDTYANYPPTIADTIAGSEKPTISSATKGQDLSLSTWTLAVTAGDIIRFNVDSCTSITRATLVIQAVK
jgi:hypothetical protein